MGKHVADWSQSQQHVTWELCPVGHSWAAWSGNEVNPDQIGFFRVQPSCMRRNCYGTARNDSEDKTLHLSNCEIPVAFGFQVLPLYRLEWIVSWNLPGGRSGLRRTQSIWQLGARIKTAIFSALFETKVHATGFYCRERYS